MVGVRFRIGASRGLKRSRLRRTVLLVVAALLHLSDLAGARASSWLAALACPWYPTGSHRQGIAALTGGYYLDVAALVESARALDCEPLPVRCCGGKRRAEKSPPSPQWGPLDAPMSPRWVEMKAGPAGCRGSVQPASRICTDEESPPGPAAASEAGAWAWRPPALVQRGNRQGLFYVP